jgi:hypothetical protein
VSIVELPTTVAREDGDRIAPRRSHADKAAIRADGQVVGSTVLLFGNPAEADSQATAPAADLRQAVSLSDAQRRVLIALCRPFKSSTAFVTPATNEQIAGELFLTVDAVKKHMRALFEKFGVARLPQNEKRARLVERAFAAGFVSEHEL